MNNAKGGAGVQEQRMRVGQEVADGERHGTVKNAEFNIFGPTFKMNDNGSLARVATIT